MLFISNDRSFKDFTGVSHSAAWYEAALAKYCEGRLHIGVAYPSEMDVKPQPPDRDTLSSQRDSACVDGPSSDIEYFPLPGRILAGSSGAEWEKARLALLGVIDEFEPDVIQCLGCEWPFGAIAEDVEIPVVIHMMGFLGVYFQALDMVHGNSAKKSMVNLMKKASHALVGKELETGLIDVHMSFERRVMKANRYFMGRTDWDRRIVKYYSPGARYFHVPEFIQWPFLREAGTWRYRSYGAGDKIRLLTVSSADDRKGNGIILQAAKLLKDVVGIDFEWRVAGHKKFMPAFERRTGIMCDEVGVRLIGMIDSEQVVRELKSADFFIHPSIVDNSPNSICEAQLVGCPVIASYVGGVPQLVEDGETGFLYPYNEPHALAFLVADLVGQRDVLERVSQAESAMGLQRHDPATLAHRYVEVYEEVLSLHEK